MTKSLIIKSGLSSVFSEYQEAFSEFAENPSTLSILKEHDAKDSTKRDYKYKLKTFQLFLNDNPLNKNSLKDFKIYLRDSLDVKSPRSRNAYLGAARVYLQLICQTIDFDYNFFINPKSFKAQKHNLRFGFELSEVQSCLTFIDTIEDEFERARLTALFSLMAFSGCRSIEAVSIQKKDIYFAEKFAYVYSKTEDEKRKVFLNSRVEKALKNYLQFCESDDYIFKGLRGKQVSHLTTRSAQMKFKRIFEILNIHNKTLHSLRHFFVTELLKYFEGDIFKVMAFSGHKSVASVRVYDQRIREKELQKDFEKIF